MSQTEKTSSAQDTTPIGSSKLLDGGRRYGKTFETFLDFIEKVKSGKEPMIVAKDYAVLSAKELNKLRQKIEDLDKIRSERDELAELCYNYATGKDDGEKIVEHVRTALKGI